MLAEFERSGYERAVDRGDLEAGRLAYTRVAYNSSRLPIGSCYRDVLLCVAVAVRKNAAISIAYDGEAPVPYGAPAMPSEMVAVFGRRFD